MTITAAKKLTKGDTLKEEEALPHDIMLDIFSRLPVKSLLRLRCLSRTWRNIVLDTHFVNMHINRPIEEKASLKLMLKCNNKLYLLDHHSSRRASKINYPIFTINTILWGTCNGLLYTVSRAEWKDSVHIWNPATGESKILPDFAKPYAGYGFGYDRSADDYELLRIVSDNVNHYSEVCIYSLRKDSCRRIGNIPYMIRDGTPGVSVKGSLYWVGSHASRPHLYNLLIAYDIGGETFRLEGSYGDDICQEINVTELGGNLCTIRSYEQRIEAWVFDKATGSWINLFMMERKNSILDFKPVCFTKNGCVILLKNGIKLMSYNPKTKRAPLEFYVEGSREVNEARTYTESIVGLGINH